MGVAFVCFWDVCEFLVGDVTVSGWKVFMDFLNTFLKNLRSTDLSSAASDIEQLFLSIIKS